MLPRKASGIEIGSELERRHSEETLKDRSSDFSAKYLAVWHLQYLAETKPHLIIPETIASLVNLLQDEAITHQTQAYFMYKAVGNALCTALIHAEKQADTVLIALQDILGTAQGPGHRAIAEACGSLPLSIQGPAINLASPDKRPAFSWSQIVRRTDLEHCTALRRMGRSLVVACRDQGSLMVFKMARAPGSLYKEAVWMAHLGRLKDTFPLRFDVPEIQRIEDAYVFRLRDAPDAVLGRHGLHADRYAIVFKAPEDYFRYPNENGGSNESEFKEIILRNAWLFGRLTSFGMVHTAPTPLFHNRVQGHRRRDQGRYEWYRGGRLDRWLDSCMFPNLGRSGIRDFEHFTSFDGSNLALYRHMGGHFLSLLLVIGSWFRNRDPQRVGLDCHGRAVDARDLFEERPLRDLIGELFLHYYQGFVGRTFKGGIPLDIVQLSARMIEELGVDRHMEEVLRIPDQKRLTEQDFREYLAKQGYDEKAISSIKKGARDVRILSGPHLGGFNERISLPELTEAVGTMSALCVLGRYLHCRGRDLSQILSVTAT
jgi:hypothetical protein